MAEDRAQDAAVEIGTPCRRNSWADATIVRVVGVFHPQVLDRLKSQDWIEDLALQRHAFLGIEIVGQIDKLTLGVD